MLGKILIANPSLEDIRFQNAVILICESTDDVVMGLILNKPLQNFSVGQLLKLMKLGKSSDNVMEKVFFGGRGFGTGIFGWACSPPLAFGP